MLSEQFLIYTCNNHISLSLLVVEQARHLIMRNLRSCDLEHGTHEVLLMYVLRVVGVGASGR